jgi:hypothetical protein
LKKKILRSGINIDAALNSIILKNNWMSNDLVSSQAPYKIPVYLNVIYHLLFFIYKLMQPILKLFKTVIWPLILFLRKILPHHIFISLKNITYMIVNQYKLKMNQRQTFQMQEKINNRSSKFARLLKNIIKKFQ